MRYTKHARGRKIQPTVNYIHAYANPFGRTVFNEIVTAAWPLRQTSLCLTSSPRWTVSNSTLVISFHDSFLVSLIYWTKWVSTKSTDNYKPSFFRNFQIKNHVKLHPFANVDLFWPRITDRWPLRSVFLTLWLDYRFIWARNLGDKRSKKRKV